MDQNQIAMELHNRDDNKKGDYFQRKDWLADYNKFILAELKIDLPYLMSFKAPLTSPAVDGESETTG